MTCETGPGRSISFGVTEVITSSSILELSSTSSPDRKPIGSCHGDCGCLLHPNVCCANYSPKRRRASGQEMVSQTSGLLLEKAQPVIGEMTSQMSLLQVYAYLAVDAVLVCADLCVPLQSLCRCSFPAPGHFRSYHRYVEFAM